MRADETPAAELWHRTLIQIPSFFGRLVYLSSLRDGVTGLYQHFGFEQRFTSRVAEQTIRRSHINTFRDWMSFSLEEQREDLEKYLDSTGGDRQTILANWEDWPLYMNWIPAHSKVPDRELFRSDLEIVLGLIRQDSGAASPGQTA